MVKAVDRSRRVGEVVHRALASIIRDRLWDQDFRLLSITAIDMARDLKKATVFVSVLGQDDEKDRVVMTLNDQAGVLRRELSKKVHLRHTPEIDFRYDSTIERGYRLNRLIDGLAVDDRTDIFTDE